VPGIYSLRKNRHPWKFTTIFDSGLVNFYRVLRNPEKMKQLELMARLTPYAREEFRSCRDTWREGETDVERAYRWFVVARMSFSGCFGHSWSASVSTSRRGMAKTVSAYLGTIDGLLEIHDRISKVQVENQDYRKIIEMYDGPGTLFYLDPPYVHATRGSIRYEHEMTDADHRDLVKSLLHLKGNALVSGYEHPIYQPLEKAGWKKKTVEKPVCRLTASVKPGKGADPPASRM